MNKNKRNPRIQVIPISGEKELTPNDKNNIIEGIAQLFERLGPKGKREAKLIRKKTQP